MANWKARTKSDAAGAIGCEYDVFLNFRGEDTRHNFTDFLYDRLVDAGVHTFRDEEKLPIGDIISDRLERAINNSTLYIPIFSWNYAFSKWCLREFKLIMENVSNSGGQKSIFPIFLLVKPEDVKLKTRPDGEAPYKAAFEEHQKNFPDEVEAWKTALEKVDERKGLVVEKNTSQAATVKTVVKMVLEKLEKKQKRLTGQPVGLTKKVNALKSLLNADQPKVQLVVIYGMGGIGKTTIAKVVFDELTSEFKKRCSFLEDVRKKSLTEDGLVKLQQQLLYDIVDSQSAEHVKNSEQGMQRIGATLPVDRVLVVLDDVDDKGHIKKLIGNSLLEPGSRIMITTRNKTLLQDGDFKGEVDKYEMQQLDNVSALQLFHQHATSRDSPSIDYDWLSSKIVSHMGGLPLAIEVIGSLLKGQNEQFWIETLAKLGTVLDAKIMETLRISYNDLDEQQQQIFLDIACFFFNEKKTDAIYMWNDCGFYPITGIEVLTNRCLIKILDNDKFWMHDQLIELGRAIIRQESPGDPTNQSRLWIATEALEIIRTNRSKDKVRALAIDKLDHSIEIADEEFKSLPNLRYLKLGNGTYVGDFAKFYSKLKWISWCSPQQDFRAENMYLDHLVVFKLDTNDFTDDSKAWGLVKRARNLKVVSLIRCNGITTIPNFSKSLGLQRLTIARCNRLKRIESFIGHLQSLFELDIDGCTDLKYLPEEVGALVKLNRFSLRGCCELSKLPNSLENLTSLTDLDLSGSGTTRRDLRWIGRLSKLEKLNLSLDLDLNLPNMNVRRGLASLSHMKELTVSKQSVKSVELPPSLTRFCICTPSGGLIHPSNKKVGIALGLHDVWKLHGALTTVLKNAEVDYITVYMKHEKIMEMTGFIDAALLVDKLRKQGFRHARLNYLSAIEDLDP